jgi:ADP-heptose:LPS heptosyltransferase
MPSPASEFFPKISSHARVLVLDLGFLGDTIHLIPALAVIRLALPTARLEVMVAEHIKSILAVCPWLDAVSGYPRFPKGPRWYQDFGRVRDLRAKKYDVVINLNGSDRSSILTRLTGAPLRLGRVPPKMSAFWPWCFTHTAQVPHGTKPLYVQHLDTLVAAGFPRAVDGPVFPITIPDETRRSIEARLGNVPPFVHVSPFATQDEKELPAPVLADFLNAAHAVRPDLVFVLSIAPNLREQSKLAALLPLLKFEPWRVFAGDLSLVELAEVIRRAQVHLGGDSGAVHVALMAGTPTLSWWRDYAGRVEWQPTGSNHFAVALVKNPAGQIMADPVELMHAFANASGIARSYSA